jgi:hypothetical protein
METYELINRLADEMEAEFAERVKGDPYGERALGLSMSVRYLRQRALQTASEAPARSALFSEGQRAIFRTADVNSDELGDACEGIVRRVCSFAVQVQATLYGDPGWGKDASGEVFVITNFDDIRLFTDNEEGWEF